MNARALRQLRDDGVDVVHAAEAGLDQAGDPDVLAWAAREDRILVTRNYRDFAPLVQAYVKQATPFPGVLFVAHSIGQPDVGHHVRALHAWIKTAEERGMNPVQNRLGWLA
jgi:hypothetical protein